MKSRRDQQASIIVGRQGIHLANRLLGIDATTKRRFCFISHAAVPEMHRHTELLLTQTTLRLRQAFTDVHHRPSRRQKKLSADLEKRSLCIPFRQSFYWGDIALELFPSGYMLGSASLHLRYQNQTAVYTGPLGFSLPTVAEQPIIPHCDLLIMPSLETTPKGGGILDRKRARAVLEETIAELFSTWTTLVIHCDPWVHAPWICQALAESEMTLQAHASISAIYRTYAESLPPSLPRAQLRALTKRATSARIVLWPISFGDTSTVRHLPEAAHVLCAPPTSHFPGHFDAHIPLGRGCHLDELVSYIVRTQAHRLVVLGSLPKALGQRLVQHKISVQSLEEQKQLSLPF